MFKTTKSRLSGSFLVDNSLTLTIWEKRTTYSVFYTTVRHDMILFKKCDKLRKLLHKFSSSDNSLITRNENVMQWSGAPKDVYQKPYCRIAVYVMGIVLGYVLHKYSSKKFNFSRVRET